MRLGELAYSYCCCVSRQNVTYMYLASGLLKSWDTNIIDEVQTGMVV